MGHKLGDFVFLRMDNPHTGQHRVEVALVTDMPERNPQWNPDGEVVGVRTFAPDGVDSVDFQTGPAEYDADGIWISGYADTPDGPEVESLSRVPQPEYTPAVAGAPVGALSAQDVAAMIQANNATLIEQLLGAVQQKQGTDAPAEAPDVTPGEDVAETTEPQVPGTPETVGAESVPAAAPPPGQQQA